MIERKQHIYMRKKIYIFSFCLFIAISSLSAQGNKDLLWDSLKVNCTAYQVNEKSAKQTYFLFLEKLKEKDYDACIKPCEWLLANYPCLNKVFYGQATSLFAKIAEKEENEIIKTNYREKEMGLYDKRLALFGEDLGLMERKGLKYYPYMLIESSFSQINAENPYIIKQLYDFYETLIVKGDSSLKYSSLFIYYFDLLNKKKSLFKDISVEEYFEKYFRIRKIIERKIEIELKKEQWEEALSAIDGLMEIGTPISCDYISRVLYPKFKENPNDKEMARRIVNLAFKIYDEEDKKKCMMSEVFKEAIRLICYGCGELPSLNIQIILLERKLEKSTDEKERNDLFTQLTSLFRVKIQQTIETKEKAQILIQLAKTYWRFHQNKIAEAHKIAIEAMQMDDFYESDAYSLIGDMCMSIYKSCLSDNPINSRYIFLLAYDMYEKAEDKIGMSNAKQQFPSKAEIKQDEMKIGQIVEINCRLKGQSKLRSRD